MSGLSVLYWISRTNAVQKKENPNARYDRWTLLNLYYENFVFINWDFFAVGQLNQPFSAQVINDDAVSVVYK